MMRQVGLRSFAVLLLVCTLSVWLQTPTAAKAERTITWEDLAPALPDLRAPFAHLKEDQFAELYELYKLVEWRKLGQAADDSALAKQIEELTERLQGQGMDVAGLMKKLTEGMDLYERSKSTPVAALNGQEIRMPGYVLPLEFGGDDAVSEFFLVPYVGACIHTPPPAENQIVLVKLDQSYKVNGLYDAVWVTGRLKIVKNDRKLGYRDGVGQVASTYELEGMKIVPYY